MKKFYLIFVLILFFGCSKKISTNQVCGSGCKDIGDESYNTSLIHLRLKNIQISKKSSTKEHAIFPLDIRIVQKDTIIKELDELTLQKSIDQLNKAFIKTNIEFFINSINYLKSDLVLENMYENSYKAYNEFSLKYDKEDIISVYIFDHGNELCEVKFNSVSCHKVGGFSYILSNMTNNVVISKYDISNQKLLAHEFGHFFGLYHTFEKDRNGKDIFHIFECGAKGDRICDTPPDPGTVFEVYVNYHTCEMNGLKDENGNDYKPLIENYMSYYKPCYMKPYSFTDGQVAVMRQAAVSEFRNHFQN